MIARGATIQKTYTIKPLTTVANKLMSPSVIITERIIKPMRREIKPIIMYPARSSKFHFSPLPSTIRFQGETQERISCGMEKKCTTNHRKFNQTWKISMKALV
tara:strand:+ start:530 stop:838 length:309 start_codon:yes stop_codon:yes gene_type:complete